MENLSYTHTQKKENFIVKSIHSSFCSESKTGVNILDKSLCSLYIMLIIVSLKYT